MTRGTIYFVTDNYIVESLEFNGGMYREEHGQFVVDMLKSVKSLSDFKEKLENFNKENHDYKEELCHTRIRSQYFSKNHRDDEEIVFTDENYFNLYFSDWTFWLNFSSNDITFKTREGMKIILPKKEVVAITFGNNAAHYFAE